MIPPLEPIGFSELSRTRSIPNRSNPGASAPRKPPLCESAKNSLFKVKRRAHQLYVTATKRAGQSRLQNPTQCFGGRPPGWFVILTWSMSCSLRPCLGVCVSIVITSSVWNVVYCSKNGRTVYETQAFDRPVILSMGSNVCAREEHRRIIPSGGGRTCVVGNKKVAQAEDGNDTAQSVRTKFIALSQSSTSFNQGEARSRTRRRLEQE